MPYWYKYTLVEVWTVCEYILNRTSLRVAEIDLCKDIKSISLSDLVLM